MGSDVTVVSGERSVWQTVLSELDDVSVIVGTAGTSLFAGKGVIPILSSWKPQTVARGTHPGTSNVVRRILLDACEKSEKSVPGSGEIVLSCCVSSARKYLTLLLQGSISLSDVSRLLQNERREIESEMFRVTKEVRGSDLQELTDNVCHTRKVSSLVKEILSVAGISSQVDISNETSSVTSIEVRKGHVFPFKTFEEMLGMAKWERKDAKILVVDGIVERVSEIDSLLTSCHEEKSSLVMFARGFSEEVIATLSVNMARKTLDVLPIRVPFDENFSNSLNDVAVTLSSDVFSSLKGDLISSISLDSLPSGGVSVSRDSVTLTPTKISLSLKNHVDSLKKRREETESETVKKSLDGRIRTLTSHIVIVSLDPSDSRYKDELRHSLKWIRAFSFSGKIDVSNLSHFPRQKKEIPLSVGLAAVKFTEKTVQSICSIGTILLLDDQR